MSRHLAPLQGATAGGIAPGVQNPGLSPAAPSRAKDEQSKSDSPGRWRQWSWWTDCGIAKRGF
jgi:hypothetical protein